MYERRHSLARGNVKVITVQMVGKKQSFLISLSVISWSARCFYCMPDVLEYRTSQLLYWCWSRLWWKSHYRMLSWWLFRWIGFFFKGDRRDVCMQMHHTHAHRLMINPTCVSTIIDPKVKAPLNANVLCNNAAHKLLSYPCSLAHSQSHPHLNGDLGLYCYSLVDGASRLPPLLLSLWDTNQQRDASGVPICPHCNKHRCFKSAEWRDQTAALRDKEKVLLLCPSGASHLHGMQRWLIFLDWNHLFYKANFRESWGLNGLLYLCHTERKQAPPTV